MPKDQSHRSSEALEPQNSCRPFESFGIFGVLAPLLAGHLRPQPSWRGLFQGSCECVCVCVCVGRHLLLRERCGHAGRSPACAERARTEAAPTRCARLSSLATLRLFRHVMCLLRYGNGPALGQSPRLRGSISALPDPEEDSSFGSESFRTAAGRG